MEQRKNAFEISVGIGLIVLCAAVLFESTNIGPPLYDPLGSAALPQMASVIIIAFSATMVFRALRRGRTLDGMVEPGSSVPSKPWIGLGFVALCISYLGLMATEITGFRTATVLFVATSGILLAGFRPKAIAIVALLALILGLGGRYLFTQVFYLDLP